MLFNCYRSPEAAAIYAPLVTAGLQWPVDSGAWINCFGSCRSCHGTELCGVHGVRRHSEAPQILKSKILIPLHSCPLQLRRKWQRLENDKQVLCCKQLYFSLGIFLHDISWKQTSSDCFSWKIKFRKCKTPGNTCQHSHLRPFSPFPPPKKSRDPTFLPKRF